MINQAGIDLIKGFESCRLQSYLDMRGIPTIGYGHTGPDVQLGQEIAQEQAEAMFEEDLSRFESDVRCHLAIEPTENELAAMVSLSYNVGMHNFTSSTLLRKFNEGDMDGAAEEFLRWDHVGHREVEGLKRRREAERELFLS